MRTVMTAVVVVLSVTAAGAERAPSPYAGLESRPIKALSEAEVAGLREGRGMSLALAAELNGHPGPLHVLELASVLSLDDDQRRRTQAVFDRMQAQAKTIGEVVLALEAELDAAFRAPQPDPALIERLTGEIGSRRGALRAVHLLAHLDMNAVLTPEQRRRYAELRGYHGHRGAGDDGASGAHAPGRHGRH